jgi:Leu/Phe-tRNA-protein transferase
LYLHYTADGFLVIQPQDDPHRIVDAMLGTGYNEEFCLSLDFDPDFIARLMSAGFLVMSTRLSRENDFILLPKLHLTRSILLFDDIHVKKSIKRYLSRFELCFDTDFDYIVDHCIEVHDDDWLTPPLIDAIRHIRQHKTRGIYPASFALYRDGKLVAGEFGIIAGRVYTSYSGYFDENNAGTVQLILTARYLQEHGFAFFDLGMPMEYKTDLGAIDVSPAEFVSLFRASYNHVD